MKNRILVVEDDPALSDILQYNLRRANYEVHAASDGMEAVSLAKALRPHLVVLDLMLPSIDGLEVCRLLRANPSTAECLVLMLTAKSEEVDQVVGFAVGADDYVTKPFSVAVLLERVKAMLRRKEKPINSDVEIVLRGIAIDERQHIAELNGKTLDLTPNEFGLLLTMMQQPGRVFSRQDLIEQGLVSEAIVLERTIDVHIRSLRRKLGDVADAIETVRGVGYRFVKS